MKRKFYVEPNFANLFAESLIIFFFTVSVFSVSAADYYISPTGNDMEDGRTPETAWQTIQKVNRSDILPGDRILFQCGGTWRIPAYAARQEAVLNLRHSGEKDAPIIISSYGKGPKPVICGSVSASETKDWVKISPNIWATRKVEFTYGKKLELAHSSWSLHREAGAVSDLRVEAQENAAPILTVTTRATGNAPNHIQLWGEGPIVEKLPETFIFRFRARATVPFQMARFHVLQSGFPYHEKCAAIGAELEVTQEWKEFKVPMRTIEREMDGPFRWHLNLGKMPANCELQIQPIETRELFTDAQFQLVQDVGNIIFDHGKFTKYHRCGIKKWKLEDLQAPGDYFYDPAAQRVFLFWPENPAKTCDSIELAMKLHGVNHGGKHDLVFDGLAVAYAASHGFGGGSCARIVIRNCDIFYVGGAHQFTREDGIPVRFGNGVEFWGSAQDCLVEKNRIWEIYDAALTNQGRGSETDPSNEIRIVYRENEIWNSEYSFEYWNSGGVTQDILVEKNICRDAGYGWAHGQRPDPNGAHLMFYNNRAKTTGFVVRENVFLDSTEVCIRMENDWRDGLTLEKNVYSQTPGKNVIRYLNQQYFDVEKFADYQKELGMDAGSSCSFSKTRR